MTPSQAFALPELTGRAALRMLPSMLRRMLPMLVLDGVLPFLLYLILRPRFASTSVVPLAVGGPFPLLGRALYLVRHRPLDTFGLAGPRSVGARRAWLCAR